MEVVPSAIRVVLKDWHASRRRARARCARKALTQRAEAETCARRQVLPSAVLSHPIVRL